MAAAVPSPESVTITINDVELQVPNGELIVESVKRLGLEIPIFCYHARMDPVGMCRMCLVEVGFKQQDGSVRMMPKPQAGCTLPASEGMVVVTDSELVHRDRRGVLEFLLINHPLDCPICDRGGECPLQNNTIFYGPSTSRYVEIKRHLPKASPLSDFVTLDLERCIQCGRCVRFTEEISGDHELAFRFRGALMQPSTFELRELGSKFSGNTIEICPVGALTSSHYRFRARPWDLETKPGICLECSNGCNIWLDHRAGRFVRVNGRTNDAVNEEWTCDRGKFGHDWYNAEDRLDTPLIRRGDRLEPCSWGDAYEAVLGAFGGDGEVAALTGPRISNEGLYLLQKLFRDAFRSEHLDHRWHPADVEPIQGNEVSPIAELERRPSILVFGTSLADDLPIVFLRVRKAWRRHGARVVAVTTSATEVDTFATAGLRFEAGSEAEALRSLIEAVESQRGGSRGPGEAGCAAEILTAAPPAIVATTGLLALPNAAEVTGLLRTLAGLLGTAFGLYPLGANECGAAELGVLPGPSGRGTNGILQACVEGKLAALWLTACDPLTEHPDADLARRAIEAVPFLVVQATSRSEVVAYASVVLPMTAPAEEDGTYTNCERRVQRMRPVLRVPGEAKPAWRIFAEASLRVNPITPFFNAGEVMEEIARTVPAYASVAYERLEGQGVLLDKSEPSRSDEPETAGSA